MKKVVLSVCAFALFVTACATKTTTESTAVANDPATQELITLANEHFVAIPQDVTEGYATLKDNPASPAKDKLGEMLYFDPRLSKSQLISCNTCHNLGFGGDDYQETSIGHGWQKGPRNAPTVLNSVYNSAQFWDGRAADLKDQAKGPIQASVEMAATPEYVVEVLNSIPEYVALFKEAFPDEEQPVTFDNMAKAIEVFESRLLTPNSAFDKFLRGDGTALNANEQAGLKVFIEKDCVSCHSGINLTSEGYYPFGVVEKPSDDVLGGDKGRFALTSSNDDEFAFKAPTLRNAEYTAPYFHSGKVWKLTEAVSLMSSSQLGIALEESEVAAIVSFLKANTGEQPNITYPVLPASTDATPKPNWN
jgi:cytochrome c peroxidase